jgi:hypothetical protein
MARKNRTTTQKDLDALREELITAVQDAKKEIYRSIATDAKTATISMRSLSYADERLAIPDERVREIGFDRALDRLH